MDRGNEGISAHGSGRLLCVHGWRAEDVGAQILRSDRTVSGRFDRAGQLRPCGLVAQGDHVERPVAAVAALGDGCEDRAADDCGPSLLLDVVDEVHSRDVTETVTSLQPFRLFPERVTPRTMSPMDASTARTLNIRRLVAEAGGPAEWARRYGGVRWQQAQVSQWISEAAPKGIGHRLARDLETAMGLPQAALDRPPNGASHRVGMDASKVAATTQALNIVLRRRRAPALNLEDAIDAELFVEVYAELEQLEGTRGSEVALGDVVADLVTKREERRNAARGTSQPAGGADRGEDRKAGAA